MALADPGGAGQGTLLVVEQQGPRGEGRVLEVTPGGKVRWQIAGLMYPWDAQLTARGNVLVVEQHNQVSERARDGKVVWKKLLGNVFSCRALPGGRVLVLGRQQLWVFDAKGNEVFSHNVPGDYILAGERFRNGHVAYLTYQGGYVRLDATGKTVHEHHLNFDNNYGVTGAAVLPGDRVLIATPSPGRLTEYDPDGKKVWEASVAAPGPPTRVANGHTLVPSNSRDSLTELDRSGRVLAEKKDLPYRPFRVYRR
jgi:hypothetical protein